MRLAPATLCFAVCALAAMAQGQAEDKKPDDSQQSTRRTVIPDDNKGQLQPQGWTGPITTGTGGAQPYSPQGPSPLDMHPAPGGSANSIVRPHTTPTQRHQRGWISRPPKRTVCPTK